jgi:hypothetical protein
MDAAVNRYSIMTRNGQQDKDADEATFFELQPGIIEQMVTAIEDCNNKGWKRIRNNKDSEC